MTEDEFLAAIQPIAPPPIRYRLYYNEHGDPLFYSQEDLPGNYIDIDRETFLEQPKFARVVDGKLVIAEIVTVKKLHPSDNGVACHPEDVSIVVDSTVKPHILWSLR